MQHDTQLVADSEIHHAYEHIQLWAYYIALLQKYSSSHFQPCLLVLQSMTTPLTAQQAQ